MKQNNKHKKFHLENEALKSNPFRVPEAYFKNLTEEVLQKTAGQTAAIKRIRMRKMFSYAAAACIILIFGLFYLNQEKSDELSNENIYNYLQYVYTYEDDVSLIYSELPESYAGEADWDFNNVSNEEIEDFLTEEDFNETILNKI